MIRYIPLKVFKRFETDSGTIEWTGKNGVVGIVPVFNSLSSMKRKYPGEEYIEIHIA